MASTVAIEDQPPGRHRRLHGNRIEQRIVAAQIKRQTVDLAATAATAAWMVTTFLLLLMRMMVLRLLLLLLLLWRSQSGSGESSRMKRFERVLLSGGQGTKGARAERQSRIETRMEKRILQMEQRPSQAVMMGGRGGGCSGGGGCFRRTQSSQRGSRERMIQILTVRILQNHNNKKKKTKRRDNY